MPTPFLFNDGNAYNSYNFRTDTDGIDLTRFTANPVMLDGHWNDTSAVIGKWQDVKKEGAALKGTPVFDVEDGRARKIAGKVERGFLNGCSMGLIFNPEAMQREPNGGWVLTKCELLEVSIVAIPSNASAVRLYVQEEGNYRRLEESEIKMCLNGEWTNKNFSKNEKQKMKKIVLSVAALVALGLDKTITNPSEGVDENVVNNAIGDLKSKLDNSEQKLIAANLALKTLQDAATAQKALAAEKIVDDAIAQGKIDATAKADWLKLATDNEALATSTLGALPAKQSLAGQVNNPAAGIGGVKTIEDFQKLTLAQQLAYKNEQPDAYRAIVSGI